VVPVAYTLLDQVRARRAQDVKALEPLEAK